VGPELSLDPETVACTGAVFHRHSAVLGPFELVQSSPRTSVLERVGGSEKVVFLEVVSS
jgi:hypothetical protein